MAGSYGLYLKDVNGNTLAVLDMFNTLEVARAVMGIGRAIVQAPASVFPGLLPAGALGGITPYALAMIGALPSQFVQVPDGLLEVWRAVDGGLPYCLGQTLFLLQRVEKTLSAQGELAYDLIYADAVDLLNRRILPYSAGASQTVKLNMALDNMAKQVVSENLGGGASDSARSLAAYLAIQGNLTAAVVSSKGAMAHRNLLKVLIEMAQTSTIAGTYMAFDVVSLAPPSGISLEFRTYTGQRNVDHRWPSSTAPLVLSPESGALTEIQRVDDYSQLANYVYAGSEGLNTVEATGNASDSASIGLGPLNRREAWRNVSSTADLAALAAEAQDELRQRRAKRIYTARLVETSALRFGIEYDWGDYLTCYFDGETVDFRFDAFQLRVADGVEELNAVLRTDV